jgi:hypothetical protein
MEEILMTQTPKSSTTHEEEKAPTTKATPPAEQGHYPASDEHKQVFGAMGETYKDNAIGRAWSRMFDRGVVLGPALTPMATNQDINAEVQYFASGKGVRSLDEANVNMTVVFSDARGPLGEESGL